MVNSNELIELLNEYEIDGEKLIKNNPNVLAYAKKDNVKKILDFLKEIGIKPKNIEKCPSILYMRDERDLRKTWNYLMNETSLKKMDVDNVLFILNSDFETLKKIYNYIVENFGIDFLTKAPGVLTRTSLEDIMDIVNSFKKCGCMQDLTAGILARANPLDVEEIIKLCKDNNIEITGSVFNKSALEVEKIIKVCRENGIAPTGNVFLKTPEEVAKIINLCNDNNVKITGSVFMRTSGEIEKIIRVCNDNNIKITASVFQKSARQIQESINICNRYGLDSANKTLLF